MGFVKEKKNVQLLEEKLIFERSVLKGISQKTHHYPLLHFAHTCYSQLCCLGDHCSEAVDRDHALIKARIWLRRPRMEDVGEIQRPIGE